MAEEKKKRLETVVQRVVWGVIGVVFISGLVGGYVRGMAGMPDWGTLHRESQRVWENGSSRWGTTMFGYLPTAVFLLWPFMVWLPKQVGVVSYVLVNAGLAGGSFWIIYRWWCNAEERKTYIWPVLLGVGTVQIVIVANQFTLWSLFFSVAGLTLVGHRKGFWGGALVGLGGLIKVMPFVLVGLFLIRRQWRALAGVVFSVVVFDLVPSLLFFGGWGMVEEHRRWLTRSDWHSNSRQIADPLLLGTYKHGTNFSYSSVLVRWLEGMPMAKRQIILCGNPPRGVVDRYRGDLKSDEWLTLDPMPDGDAVWSVRTFDLWRLRRFGVGHFSSQVVWGIWAGTLGVGFLVLCWFTWRGRIEDDWQIAGATWVVMMFFALPMMRDYYLVLGFPALVLVWNGMVNELRERGRWNWRSLWGVLVMAGWGVGVLSMGWNTGKWYGIHWVALGMLLVGSFWVWKKKKVRKYPL
ncbi:MAG: glycosyltransferase family 87 protein [Phycisphaerae bacterium]